MLQPVGFSVSECLRAESCFPLTRIIKRNDLPHLTFHGLRHAFATIALKAGINAKIVSEAFSYSKVGITIDLHQHLLANMQPFSPNPPPTSLANTLISLSGRLRIWARNLLTQCGLWVESQTVSNLSAGW